MKYEFEGKNEKEAIEIAASELGLERDQFDVEILESQKNSLFKKGYAVSPVHAYSKFLDVGKNAYVEREKMGPEKLIDTIIKCGGVPVLAHPKSLKLNNNDLDIFIRIFNEAGLCGIEVYNPHNSNEKREELLELCEKYNLISTVGSDFHNFNSDIKIGLGINENLKISDYSIITRLKEKKYEIDQKIK